LAVVIPNEIMLSFKWKCFLYIRETVDYREERTGTMPGIKVARL
jgi:hypothetical protein